MSQHRQHVSLDAPESCWCAFNGQSFPSYSDVPLVDIDAELSCYKLTLWLGASSTVVIRDLSLDQIEHLAAALVQGVAEQRQSESPS